MNLVKPVEILKKVAGAVPGECRKHMVVIGSLAAGYAYSGEKDRMEVRTKDLDCMLKPQHMAPEKGAEIARQLLDAGWQPPVSGDHTHSGTAETPDDQLPAIRLYPPDVNPEDEKAWFIELLSEPESAGIKRKKWYRVVVGNDHFGLPSFRFLSITAFRPEKIEDLEIEFARPQMMALANLLEHPEIKQDVMKAPFAGRYIRRSNKDLGRVLALGYMAEEKGMTDFRSWGIDWIEALQICFSSDWKILARNAGKGLKALLSSPADMEEAHHTCTYGLLSSYAVSEEALKITGDRLLGEAIGILVEATEKPD